MRNAKIISNALYTCGVVSFLATLIFHLPEIFISGTILLCSGAIVESLVFIFSEDKIKDTEES